MYLSWIAFRAYATMLFEFVALKRPDLFELFGKIVRTMRAKKKKTHFHWE